VTAPTSSASFEVSHGSELGPLNPECCATVFVGSILLGTGCALSGLPIEGISRGGDWSRGTSLWQSHETVAIDAGAGGECDGLCGEWHGNGAVDGELHGSWNGVAFGDNDVTGITSGVVVPDLGGVKGGESAERSSDAGH